LQQRRRRLVEGLEGNKRADGANQAGQVPKRLIHLGGLHPRVGRREGTDPPVDPTPAECCGRNGGGQEGDQRVTGAAKVEVQPAKRKLHLGHALVRRLQAEHSVERVDRQLRRPVHVVHDADAMPERHQAVLVRRTGDGRLEGGKRVADHVGERRCRAE